MKKRKHIELFDVCNTAFMLLMLLIIIYPLYYTVIASVSSANAVAGGDVVWKPVGFTWAAYEHVFTYKPIWVGYANTIYYTVLGTIYNLVLTIPAAYALSKKNLPCRNFIMTLFLITMYFGGGMVPAYLQIKNMGLLNSRIVLIILGGVSVYNLIVTRTYFSSSISESLYEAADIDGAGEFRKFVSIAIPLAKPIIAVMLLYYAVSRWNGYFDALLYVSDRELQPLQLILRRVLILNESAVNAALASNTASVEELMDAVKRSELAYIVKYAVVFVASAPLLIAYPFVQKYFVKGVMIGAVKE